MSDNLICANVDCPKRTEPVRACIMPDVVIAEAHQGKQKKFRIHLCFECYGKFVRNPENRMGVSR